MIQLHHVAIAVKEYDKYVALFSSLGLSIQRETGVAPNRQLWFEEGIQIKEIELFDGVDGLDYIDHIALGTDNSENVIKIAIENDCSMIEERENWFKLPNKINIELMEN